MKPEVISGLVTKGNQDTIDAVLKGADTEVVLKIAESMKPEKVAELTKNADAEVVAKIA